MSQLYLNISILCKYSVTKHDGGDENTISYETGRGNFYTRYGQITEWTRIQDQYQRNEAIRRDGDKS